MTREKRRIAILNGAGVVFSKKGFHGARMDEIANEAGVGKGTIYGYFESKEALFQELIKYGIEEYKEGMEKALRVEGSCKEKIVSLFKYHGYYLSKYIDITQVVMNQQGLLPRKLKKEIINEKIKLLNMIEEVMEDGKRNKELRGDLDISLATLSIVGSISNFYGKEIFYYKREYEEICPEPMVDLLFEGLK